jgi:TRAP-type C4-dicarboxylate transport system permease small subunit
VRAVSRVSAWISGALLTIAALVIGYDIFIRYFFNKTMGGGTEVAGYSLAIASAWGITVALMRRGHVRIDAVYTHLPRRLRALLDIIGLVAFIVFFGLVTRYAYGVVEQSYISGTHSVSSLDVPLIVPQSVWLFGLAFFLIAAALLLARSVIAFIKGDLATVHGLIGARSTTEEVEAEQVSRTGGRDES